MVHHTKTQSKGKFVTALLDRVKASGLLREIGSYQFISSREKVQRGYREVESAERMPGGATKRFARKVIEVAATTEDESRTWRLSAKLGGIPYVFPR